MDRSGRKRNHAQYARDYDRDAGTTNKFGVASTLAHLRAPEDVVANATDSTVSPTNDVDGEWETVERRSKKPRRSIDSADRERHKQNKPGSNNSSYPALSYSELHRLQASIKISDLQSLVLYCLADGSSPQWVSLRHHRHVTKAVVLMVPGLEKGMFDGRIVLPDSTCNGFVDQAPPGASHGHEPSSKADSVVDVANSTRGMQASSSGRNTSPDDYLPMPLVADTLPMTLKPLANMFTHIWPVKAPGDDKYCKVHSPLHAMLAAPIPKAKEDKREVKREDKNSKAPKPFQQCKTWENKRTPITTFLASNKELQENEYVLHPAYFTTQRERDREIARRQNAKETAENGWKDAHVVTLDDGAAPDLGEVPEGSMTAGRNVLAMDCEMCKTEGGNMDLTRISIVAWDSSIVMDELVKPEKPIIDYLTPYSGITPAKLDAVTTTLSDIQSRLLELLTPQTIVIGHSLNADLTALRLTHPFIIDTSILYQHPRGPPLKSSLKWLSQKYLNREIQKGHGTRGHDSIEDAIACLDLVKMKCEKGVAWGTSEASGEPIFKRLSRTSRTGTPTSSGSDGRTGAVVDHGSPERNFGATASICIGCTDDSGVVEAVKRTVHGDEDGKLIPGGGVDFTWARMRELEALRGWSDDHRSPDTIHDSATNSNHNALYHDLSPTALSSGVARTVQHIASIYASLPPCTLIIVYSGTGDPREMSRLQSLQRQFKQEYATKRWDELSVKWTDVEEQALRRACGKAREGVGFCLRRVAFRALSFPSTSAWTSNRSITTITRSIAARPSRQTFLLSVQKRFASDDVTRSEPEAETSATSGAPKSADENEDSTIASAISSTTHNATSRASNAYGSVAQAMGSARDTVTGAAQAAAGSVGLGFGRDFVSPSKSLYVGNLFFDVTIEDLKKEMQRFGTVLDVRIIMDNRGLSKGFGYVDFETEEQAAEAQQNMNQAVFEGRRMTVQFSQPRESRQAGDFAPKNPPSKTLFIGNMSFDMTDQDLNDMFRPIKNVIDVRVAIDRRTGQPRGFAHADFVDTASAEKAFEVLKEKEVYGRKLRLDYSASKMNTGRDRAPRDSYGSRDDESRS